MRHGFGFHDRHSPFRFNPATLFAGGAIAGPWWDPSDLSTLHQDSAGTIPVTDVEQVVGRMLDKSGNGNTITGTGAARPTLSARVNLLLATDTLSTQSVTTVATTYTLYFTGTGSIALSGTATGTYSAGTNTITCTAGTLTLTVTGTVTTADLRVSNESPSAPLYQRVTTDTDYDSVGFPLYLLFSGNRAMQTSANVDFSNTQALTVFAGIRRLNDSAAGIFLEASTNYNSFTDSFSIVTPSGANTIVSGGLRGNGGYSMADYTDAAAPNSGVFTLGFNKTLSTDEISPFRKNGASVSVSRPFNTNNTNNFGARQLNLGARNNGAGGAFFNGRLYGLIVLGAAASDWQVQVTEQWMAGKTGLQF